MKILGNFHTRLGWWLHATGFTLLVGSLFAYGQLVAFPLARAYERDREHVKWLRDQFLAGPGLRSKHAELQRTLMGMLQPAEAIRQRVPEEPREAEFLRMITEIADATGVRLREYTPGEVESHERHAQFEAYLKCEGTYHAICEFFARLHELPRLTTARELKIEPSRGEDVYPFELRLMLYFRLQPGSSEGPSRHA